MNRTVCARSRHAGALRPMCGRFVLVAAGARELPARQKCAPLCLPHRSFARQEERMDRQLLAIHTHRPPLPAGLAERARLIDAIEDAFLEAKVVLVAAPAGSGCAC